MPKLIVIAAIAANNVIGKNGTTPWNIPDEMALFKTITIRHPVIMGRKTYDSIGHPLPGRRNIVLSHTLAPTTSSNFVISPSIPHALEEIRDAETAFVIGGQQIYAQMMPFADEMIVSHLKEAYEGDSFFPPIHEHEWEMVEEKEFPAFIHSRYIRI